LYQDVSASSEQERPLFGRATNFLPLCAVSSCLPSSHLYLNHSSIEQSSSHLPVHFIIFYSPPLQRFLPLYPDKHTPSASTHRRTVTFTFTHTHTRPCALNQMSPRPSAPMAFTRTAMVPTAPATETTRDTGKTAQAALRARQARYGHTADFFTQCL
jgi:hypothetical protein